MDFKTLFWAAGAGVALAAAVPLLLAALPAVRNSRAGAAAGTVGLGAGYLAAHWVESGWPGLPPLDVVGWTFWFAAAATGLGVLEAVDRPPPRWRSLPRAAVAVALAFCFVGPLALSTGLKAAWTGGLPVGLFAWWTLLERLGGRSPGLPQLAVLFATACGASVAMMMSGSEVLGGLGAAFTASLGAGAAMGLILRRPSMVGIAGVTATVLAALLVNSHLYVDLRAAPALLLVVAPVIGLGTMRALERKTGALRAAGLGLVAALVPLGAAVALAVRDSPAF